MQYWISNHFKGQALKIWRDEPMALPLSSYMRSKTFKAWSLEDLHGEILAFRPEGQEQWYFKEPGDYACSYGEDPIEISEEEAIAILSKSVKEP